MNAVVPTTSSLIACFTCDCNVPKLVSRYTRLLCFEEYIQAVCRPLSQELDPSKCRSKRAMGIWDTLHILYEKVTFCIYVLWKYVNGNINTCNASMEAEVSTLTLQNYIARYPTLRYYAREQLRFGKRLAGGSQGDIYEAQLASAFSIKLVPVIVKKFRGRTGVNQGLFPLEFVTYKNMYVCKPDGFFFDDDGSLCMIMDRYSGDLRHRIDSEMKLRRNVGPPFTEPVAVSVIMQLALALKSLHGRKIYHRDIKCENILVQTKLEEMLIPSGASDMNFAIGISDFESSDGVVGTGVLRAPEVLKVLEDNKGQSIFEIQWEKTGIQWGKVDVFAFGMTCYEILAGISPFEDEFCQDQLIKCAREKVMSGGRPNLLPHIPENLKDMMQRCWDHEPKARPTFDAIICHLKENYKELWDFGFSKVESMMRWESSLETPEAILRELVRLVVTDTTEFPKTGRQRKIASKLFRTTEKFVRSAEKFVRSAEKFTLDPRFGWRSFARHPSLPFVDFVEREGLYALMSSYYTEEYDIYTELVHLKGTAVERKTRILSLTETVFFTAIDGVWGSIYSGHEGLVLSDKLSIVMKAFVKPLLDAGVKKLLIFKEAKRLLQVELSREYHQEYHRKQIERFQILFMLSISPLLVPNCAVRLQDIVGFPVVEFLVVYIFSFRSMRIFCFYTKYDGGYFLKVLLDQLTIDFFLPAVFTISLQFKLLGWGGLLRWWLLDGILKILYFLTWRFTRQSLRPSTFVLYRICCPALSFFLEMQWIHYLALTMK